MSKASELIVSFIALGCAQPAVAQMNAPPIPSELPSVAPITAGNAAGVLQYCMKKNLVSTVSAGAVLDRLNKKPDIARSRDFAAGQSGVIIGSKHYSIGKAPGVLQSRACDMVLNQAKTLR